MTNTLITGANKGLGFETARRLVAAGHTVHVGSRDEERGRRAAERLGARSVHLDVTDDASVAATARTIEAEGGLDVLINNAGIEGRARTTASSARRTPRPTRCGRCSIRQQRPGLRVPEQGTEVIVRMARLGPDGPTGGYFSADGPLPW